jgi:hypothetical protein
MCEERVQDSEEIHRTEINKLKVRDKQALD